MEYRLWTLADQMLVKPISDNNIDKFTQLQMEVEYNDIVQYLGAEFYQELKRNLANYAELMDGGTYMYNGVSYEFAGLKTMFCYLLYARYVRDSYVQDTFNGMVRHSGDNFTPLSANELINQENRYKQIAGSIWDECLGYLRTLNLPYFPRPETRGIKIQAL